MRTARRTVYGRTQLYGHRELYKLYNPHVSVGSVFPPLWSYPIQPEKKKEEIAVGCTNVASLHVLFRFHLLCSASTDWGWYSLYLLR